MMKKRGFTLIEALVYIALLGILMVGAVETSYQLAQSSNSLSTKNTAGEEGNFFLRKLNWALTGTSSLATITTPSAAAPYSSALTLTRADGNTVTFRRKTAGSAAWIEMSESTNGGVFASTTTSNVNVSTLSFHFIAPTNGSPAGIEASTTVGGLVFYTEHYVRK